MAPGGPPGGHRWNFTFRVDRVAHGGAAVGGGSGSTDCRRGASNSQPGCAPILAPSSCMYSVILKEIHDDDDDLHLLRSSAIPIIARIKPKQTYDSS